MLSGTSGFSGFIWCQIGSVHFNLSCLATCGNNSFQCFLLMCCISFHGVYQIRNQVGTTLVLSFYICPLTTYILVHSNQTVIYTYCPYDKDSHNG